MAVADWLNANVVGDLSVTDLGNAALGFYDTYQAQSGLEDATNEVIAGYDQGINTVTGLHDQSTGIMGDVYDTTMGNANPYITAGHNALGQYMGLLDDPSSIREDPGYLWRLQHGEETRKRDLEAAGYADPMGSGARPVGLEEWAQGFATQEYDSALNRRIEPMREGLDATRIGMMAGDSYSRGMVGANQALGQSLVPLYQGKADAVATLHTLKVAAMSQYLQGASGLLNGINSQQGLLQTVLSALTGQTTSDGQSLWTLLGEAFGFDPSDSSILDTIIEAVTGQPGVATGPGSNPDGSINWGEIASTIGGVLDLGDIGDIDWENILDLPSMNWAGTFGDVYTDLDNIIDWGSISTDLFGDLDLGDIGNIDWDNLFQIDTSWFEWDDAGNIVPTIGNGIDALFPTGDFWGIGGGDFNVNLDPNWAGDLLDNALDFSDWGSSFFL